MIVCLPVAPAKGPMAGVPAHAQRLATAQPAKPKQPAEPEQPANGGKAKGKGKYKLAKGRRRANDTWPGFTNNEAFDVERLWHWVNRGSHTPSQRMCPWKGEKIDVALAYELLQRERALDLQQQPLGVLNSSMTLPQVTYGMPQPADHLQDFSMGYQRRILPELQASPPAQQGPFIEGHSGGDLPHWGLGNQALPQHPMQVNMPAQQFPIGMPQYAESLQGQGWGYQNPSHQHMQVSQPAPQLPLHPAYGLGPSPAFLSQYDPGFSGPIGGLHSRSSSSESPSNLDLYADNSSVGLSWGSSQSSLPFVPEVAQGTPDQLPGGISDVCLTGMGAWNSQPALEAGDFPPLNGDFGDLAATGDRRVGLDDISPLGGAQDVLFDGSFLSDDAFLDI